MVITNKNNLPEALLKACDTSKHNKKNHYSATTLKNGYKEIILTNRHWDEIERDVSDMVWALFGQAVHALLEHETETQFSEIKLEYAIEGVIITGRIDNYDMATGISVDWKTCAVWKFIYKDFDDWKSQGDIYAWLAIKNRLPMNESHFYGFMKDHSKSKARYDKSYPQNPIGIYKYKTTEDDIKKTEAFIIDKVKNLKVYEELPDDEIPPCTESERWASGTKYAVMKQSRKSAVRVFDKLEDAEVLAQSDATYYIETRLGENKKCIDYCACNKFCNFYKSLEENK